MCNKEMYFIKNIKAAILTQTKKPLLLADVNFKKLEERQILVKVFYSGICGSQLMEIDGKRGEDKWLPHLLGHEGSGVVVEVGSKVKKFKIGDEVILGWLKNSGIESSTPNFFMNHARINAGNITTFSNYTVVSENRLTIKPKKLPRKEAVLYGCALLTGYGMVNHEVKIKKDSNVLVYGLGGIGTSVYISLLSKKIKNIVIIDKSKDKKNLISYYKKGHFIEAKNKTYITNQLGKLNINSFDYIFESCGKTQTIEHAFELLSKNGNLVFASHPNFGEMIKIDPFMLISGKKIIGTWGGSVVPERDIPVIFNELRKLKISLKPLVNKIYPLKAINTATNDLRRGNVFRANIKMEH